MIIWTPTGMQKGKIEYIVILYVVKYYSNQVRVAYTKITVITIEMLIVFQGLHLMGISIFKVITDIATNWH